MNFDFISTWAQAIAQFEGFNTAGNRAQRNNNPGNLKFAGQPGAIGADSGGFAIFPDPGTGFQALYTQLQKYVVSYPGYSILDITAKYLGQSAPTSDSQGNAYTYAGYVASALGVDVSTTLAQLSGSSPATDVSPDLSTVDPSSIDSSTVDATTTGISTLAVLGVIGLIAFLWLWE
jgi:hypothetical protein